MFGWLKRLLDATREPDIPPPPRSPASAPAEIGAAGQIYVPRTDAYAAGKNYDNAYVAYRQAKAVYDESRRLYDDTETQDEDTEASLIEKADELAVAEARLKIATRRYVELGGTPFDLALPAPEKPKEPASAPDPNALPLVPDPHWQEDQRDV